MYCFRIPRSGYALKRKLNSRFFVFESAIESVEYLRYATVSERNLIFLIDDIVSVYILEDQIADPGRRHRSIRKYIRNDRFLPAN